MAVARPAEHDRLVDPRGVPPDDGLARGHEEDHHCLSGGRAARLAPGRQSGG